MEWFKEIFWTIGPLLISLVVISVVVILLIRWIGGWAFRTNEIIKLQKEILEELRKKNSSE